jgi:hypothetical protein
MSTTNKPIKEVLKASLKGKNEEQQLSIKKRVLLGSLNAF